MTGMKQETVGLRWATSTHSNSAVSAVSRPRNALAGIDLCRLIYRAAFMVKKLRAEKPQARTHFFFFEKRFFLNAFDKRTIVCKIALFVVKFALIVVWRRY